MKEQSLFLFIKNHQDVFEAMADLLKRSSAAVETGSSAELLFWCGLVVTAQAPKKVGDCVMFLSRLTWLWLIVPLLLL
jgi:hypothetical protein